MARGGFNNSPNPPSFIEGFLNGQTTVISERDRIVLRRSARARRAGRLRRPRRTTLVFGITQVILGLVIVAVSFTAFALSTSNRIRNACPYWAGFSVLFTGGVGLIAWKQPSSLAISFFTFLSALCVVLHLVATALSGLSCAELQNITNCRRHPGNFVCYCCTTASPCDPADNSISIEGVRDCSIISSTIRLVMFIICVANVAACLVCIAATIVGCAYIVKRHAMRRMLLRRPHHVGSIARDSYISDIGGVIDPIFTPPLVPPPPYSPPEYTEISNDPIIVEGPDFLDDLSTPTPVMPVAPHEMPPPYSSLDILPGATIECSVAQEFQLTNDEITDPCDNRVRESRGDGNLGDGYIEANPENHVPVPPRRWDSHHVALELAHSVGLAADALAIATRTSNSDRRRRSRNRRRRPPSDGRSVEGDQSSRRLLHDRYVFLTLPSYGQTAMGMQAPDHRTNTCLEDRRERIHDHIAAGSGNGFERTALSNRDMNMLEPLENRNPVILPTENCRTENCSSQVLNGNMEGSMENIGRNALPQNIAIDLHNGNNSPSTNSPSSNTNVSSGSPQQTLRQIENSPTGSSERLTGGTGSSSSRNTRTSSSSQRRQRRRKSSDRRMRTSSSNYSTSSTDHSSKSSGGIRQTARARQQQLFSTSSSSDSEDNTPQRPRRLVAKMVNGTVTHELETTPAQSNAQSSRPSRSRRHTRGSRNRQRPVSAQPALNRHSTSQSQGSAPNKANGKSGPYHDRIVTAQGLSPSSIHFNQQGRVKQKRPDSLDLKLLWSSHRGFIGQNSLSTSSSADSYDPWVPRDGLNVPNNEEKLVVNLAVEEKSSPKVPEKLNPGPGLKKKRQLRRVAEGRSFSKPSLPSSLQTNNDSYQRFSQPTDDPMLRSMGLPQSVIKRERVTPEKDIDTTECCNFTENSTNGRDRPKSMIDFDKDTTALVSEILMQADADISPAVKSVLQDIHSVIANDDKYLSEIWQSACILEKLSNKCSRQKSSKHNGVVHFNDNREQDSVQTSISKSEQMKFRHSCPDADDMLRQAEKMLSVSREDLVKSLEGARETVL